MRKSIDEVLNLLDLPIENLPISTNMYFYIDKKNQAHYAMEQELDSLIALQKSNESSDNQMKYSVEGTVTNTVNTFLDPELYRQQG